MTPGADMCGRIAWQAVESSKASRRVIHQLIGNVGTGNTDQRLGLPHGHDGDELVGDDQP